MVETERKKPGLFARLKEGLARTTQSLTQGITRALTRRTLDQEALDELEELLVGADMGANVAADVVAEMKRTRFNSQVSDDEIRGALAEEIAKILRRVAKPLHIDPARKPADDGESDASKLVSETVGNGQPVVSRVARADDRDRVPILRIHVRRHLLCVENQHGLKMDQLLHLLANHGQRDQP